MNKKIPLIIISLFISASAFANTFVDEFDEKNIPILNEELRKADKGIESANSDITTNTAAIAAITEGLWEVDSTEHQLITADEIDMQSKKIINVTDPGDAQDAATKNYVDNSGVPSGVILMWSGTVATIPSGWSLCDGNGGTPDLRDKFIVGVTQDDSGTAKTNVTGSLTQTGGSATHDHGAGTYVGPSHDHGAGSYLITTTIATIAGGGPNYVGFNIGTTTVPVTGTSATGGTGSITGTSATGSSLPPYYALCFIMKD